MKRFERLPQLIGTVSVTLCAATTGVLSGVLSGAGPGLALGNAAVAQTDAAPMTLITQELALAQDAPLTITFLPPSPIAPTDTIIVGAYRRIDSRAELTDAIAGGYGRVIDSVRLDPNDPAVFAVDPDGLVTVTVASESVGGTPVALQFPRGGLYPVTVDVQRDGGLIVSELLTFVDRVAAADDEDKGELGVAVVASITAPPEIPGADTPLPDDVIAQIAELVRYPATFPLSVSISPEVLGRLDEDTLDSLRAVMSHSVVLAQPSIPLDPSAAAAADQQDLFTQLLRSGEDDTAARAVVRPSRSAWIESAPLTTAGAALLRDLGVGLLLLSPETYADAGAGGGYLRDYTLYSQLRNTQLPDGSSIATAIFDPTIDRNLIDSAMSPELAALYTAADLVAWRDQLYSDLPPVTGNSVLLGLSAGGVLDHERIARLADMVTATGAATFTDLTAFSRSTNVQIVDGNEATLTLASQRPTELRARALSIIDLSARQATVSSMLVDDAGRTERWIRTIQTLASSAITDAQVEATKSTLIEQFDAITSAVVAPESYTFTMNGLSADLHPRITNNGNEPLNVLVRLQSSADKMQFPAGDVEVTLPANESRTVTIPVRARSNGSFTVTLQVLAPDGVTPITAPTILKAQVNALTGLAQVFTGGGLLILLTWWVRNLRRSRRHRRNVAVNIPTRAASATGATAISAAATVATMTTIAELDTSNGNGAANGSKVRGSKVEDVESSSLSDS